MVGHREEGDRAHLPGGVLGSGNEGSSMEEGEKYPSLFCFVFPKARLILTPFGMGSVYQ